MSTIKLNNFFVIILFIVICSCNPITKIQIETIKPASHPIPYNTQNVLFVNLENDINNDLQDDSVLVNMIYNEFLLGVDDIVRNSPRIDSQNVYKAHNYLSKNLFYNDDNSVNWNEISRLNICKNTDVLFLLDSVYIIMDSNNSEKIFNYDHYEYYKYRNFLISAYFTTVDIRNKKVLDRYNYRDSLLWEDTDVDINILEKKFPDIKKSIKISGYWLGYDFASRVFPYWIQQERTLYVTGNRDFNKAAQLFNKSDYIEASKLWEKYLNHYDKELVSRATYNLALVCEMNELYDDAIKYLIKSYKAKPKIKTKEYIIELEQRRIDNNKLKKQLP